MQHIHQRICSIYKNSSCIYCIFVMYILRTYTSIYYSCIYYSWCIYCIFLYAFLYSCHASRIFLYIFCIYSGYCICINIFYILHILVYILYTFLYAYSCLASRICSIYIKNKQYISFFFIASTTERNRIC